MIYNALDSVLHGLLQCTAKPQTVKTYRDEHRWKVIAAVVASSAPVCLGARTACR